VGNLYPFIKIKEEQQRGQRLAFLNRRPKDLEAWKAECGAKVLDALGYRPDPCRPDAQIFDRMDKGDYIRERLTFHTAPNVTVPAYLLLPKAPSSPPGSLGCTTTAASTIRAKNTSSKRRRSIRCLPPPSVPIRRRQLSVDTPRHGYVVLTVDMYYFLDRRLIVDEDLEHVIYKSTIDAVVTWAGVLAWDTCGVSTTW
jgi:hypothetical protein